MPSSVIADMKDTVNAIAKGTTPIDRFAEKYSCRIYGRGNQLLTHTVANNASRQTLFIHYCQKVTAFVLYVYKRFHEKQKLCQTILHFAIFQSIFDLLIFFDRNDLTSVVKFSKLFLVLNFVVQFFMSLRDVLFLFGSGRAKCDEDVPF